MRNPGGSPPPPAPGNRAQPCVRSSIPPCSRRRTYTMRAEGSEEVRPFRVRRQRSSRVRLPDQAAHPAPRSGRRPPARIAEPAHGWGRRTRHSPAAGSHDTRCGALPDSDPECPAHRIRGDIPVPLTSPPHAFRRAGRRSYRHRGRCHCSSPTPRDRTYNGPPHTDRESDLRPHEELPSPPRSAVPPG